MKFSKFRKFGVVAILIALIIVFTIINPIFFSPQNLVNILRQVAIMAVLSIGMTFVLLSGGIDLSQGSVIALFCVVVGKLVAEMGLPAPVGLLIGVLMAVGVGVANGVAVAKVKVPPLIFTLGMSTALGGVAFTISGGVPVYGIPDSIKMIGQTQIGGVLPLPVIIMVIVLAFGIFLLKRTYLGRYFYAVGSNEEAAKLSGINTDKVRIIIYTLDGLMVGIASIIMLGRIGSGQPNAGLGYEMDVLTACVLGGVSLTGGKGTILEAFIGVLIIGVLSTGMALAGLSEFTQQIVKGVVLMAAVLFDSSQYIKRKKKLTKITTETATQK